MKLNIIKNKIRFVVGIIIFAAISIVSWQISSGVSASTLGILPSSDGNYHQWTRYSAGSTHYTAVDEDPCNGLTDYVYTEYHGQRESFGVNLSAIPDGAIIIDIALIPCASLNTQGGSGSSVMNVFFRWNGNNSPDMGNYSLASGVTPASLTPVTAYDLWLSKSGSSTLEIGAIFTSGTSGVRLSRIATVITYALPKIAWQKCVPNETVQCDVWVMNADGSGATNLTPTTSSSFDLDPRWSRDHSKVVFASTRNSSDANIFTMNGDGTGVTQLTSDSGFETFGSFSPDGTRIVFSRSVSGKMQIYAMNSDGTGVVRLTNNSYEDEAQGYSPDGSKILFASNRDGQWEIYVMNADGSGATRLTNNSASDRYPAWSPNGQKIAFASDRDGSSEEVYTMNSDGTGATRLTFNTGYPDSDPTYFADGSKIFFTSARDGNAEIYVMNADGSGQTRVTNNSAFDGGPDW